MRDRRPEGAIPDHRAVEQLDDGGLVGGIALFRRGERPVGLFLDLGDLRRPFRGRRRCLGVGMVETEARQRDRGSQSQHGPTTMEHLTAMEHLMAMEHGRATHVKLTCGVTS